MLRSQIIKQISRVNGARNLSTEVPSELRNTVNEGLKELTGEAKKVNLPKHFESTSMGHALEVYAEETTKRSFIGAAGWIGTVFGGGYVANQFMEKTREEDRRDREHQLTMTKNENVEQERKRKAKNDEIIRMKEAGVEPPKYTRSYDDW